jgi:hypothetical protein
LTAVALRLLLAEAPIGQRGFAAGAGVAAASIGAMAGLMIGAGESMSLGVGAQSGMSAESLVLIGAALVALGLASTLTPQPPDESGQRDGVWSG